MLLLFGINLLARLPFLHAGYGREEDAWAQALTAKGTWESGVYEVSRLPGHPIYELLLALLWPLNHSYFFFNLLSALASSLSVVYFYKILKRINSPQPLSLALSLGLIPVFFISGVYTIDYNFALLFILLSFYKLQKDQLIWAGVFLGIATGFRISSIALLLPWMILYPNRLDFTFYLKLGISAVAVSIISFLPPFLSYGIEFLDFHKPPYASWAKIAFKLTFGIWGVLLFAYLGICAAFQLLRKQFRFKRPEKFHLALLIIVGLQLLIFFRLPFKSEFLIPALPFLLIFFGSFFTTKQLRALPYISILSCFLFGFDYQSEHRGSPPSKASLSFAAGGKNIYFDALQGPAIIDHRKRLAKMGFVDKIIDWSDNQNVPSHVVAGWYWPQIMLKVKDGKAVNFDYYSTEAELVDAYKSGKKIFFLPEINEANAKIEGHYIADSLGTILSP